MTIRSNFAIEYKGQAGKSKIKISSFFLSPAFQMARAKEDASVIYQMQQLQKPGELYSPVYHYYIDISLFSLDVDIA